MTENKQKVRGNFLDTNYLNRLNLFDYRNEWVTNKPFSHIIIDEFLNKNLCEAVANEFPNFESESWKQYNNAIEIKKLLNNWDKFGQETYKLFNYLNSRDFISQLEILTQCDLFADFGLNGGGLHTHKSGGKLNTHLDYSIHPKLKLERRLNLLIYVTPNWKDEYGGFLGLWDKLETKNAPGKLVKSIAPKYNRAIIFDTTQDSWHGLPEPIECPESITRNSLAIYYLCKPRQNALDRGKALFFPTKEQENNPEVLSLIEKRSKVNSAADVYGDKNIIS